MEQFPVIMRNTIDACIKHNTKLVFFDNTYMYPQNSIPLTENSPFEPVGPRGKVRAEIATMLLNEMEAKRIEAVICRAPEFYGPDKTKSLTNTLIFENIKKRKPCKVLLRDDTLRTLIWTPDAGKATALIGNSPDTYNQTWHLPCDDNRLTYKQMVDLASAICGDEIVYSILGKFTLKIGGLFSKEIREIQELLPRYSQDNIFVSDKFKKRFPEFEVTTYRDGFEILLSNNQ
jgi:nucleoside-diphosphate-sugar epimerase